MIAYGHPAFPEVVLAAEELQVVARRHQLLTEMVGLFGFTTLLASWLNEDVWAANIGEALANTGLSSGQESRFACSVKVVRRNPLQIEGIAKLRLGLVNCLQLPPSF